MTVFDKEFWENKGYILRDCSLSKEWVNDEEYNLHINVDVQKVTTIDKIICELIIS
jgi:hypothetical protein